MRRLLERLLPPSLLKEIKGMKHLPSRIDKIDRDLFQVSDVIQKSLVAMWTLGTQQGSRYAFSQVGFKAFSQFEEDGILLYLFTMIGTSSKVVVELCAGDGRECMATNLILHHGWTGFLWDGDADNVRRGRQFFAEHPASFLHPPSFQHDWLTQENVNSVLASSGLNGDIDLLSIDIDGNDLWLWDAITQVQPRAVIIESMNPIPSNRSLTVGYAPRFNASNRKPEEQDFRGASALALARIGKRKGYRLIGAHRYGFNLVFLRNDIDAEFFPEVSVESVHANAYTRWSQENRWPVVEKMPWQEVT
jgi:hypothetical protein